MYNFVSNYLRNSYRELVIKEIQLFGNEEQFIHNIRVLNR